MQQQQHSSPKITAGEHHTFWIDSVKPIAYHTLTQDSSTEVVIVGGGIAGVTIAYCLLKSGKKVALVEDGFIGSGETGRTTAHLVTALDDRYYELARIYGEEKAKDIAQSHAVAIDFVEEIIRKENIACDFKRVDGYLFLHPTDKKESLDKELEAATKAGIDISKIYAVPAFPDKKEALKFGQQAQFHPVKYLAGLCAAIEKMGGKIYTRTHAAEINSEGITSSEGFHIKAEQVVVATNTPVNNKYVMHLKQYAYRTYVIGIKIKKGQLPEALWWDTGDFEKNANIPPYHYIRTQSMDETHDLLLVGGEDHATGLADAEEIPEEERYGFLKGWVKINMGIEGEIVYKWSGEVMEPMDSLAYIGRNPFDKENVYIVTGDSGNGMTHCTIAGMLITDLINGKENKWEKIYDPHRFKFLKTGNIFLKEFFGGLVAYLKTKGKDADKIKLSDIKADEGNVIEVEGEKYGVYRDQAGEFHFVGAECTHLGCIIKWNNDEKSWDCPCHGSRFNYKGEVLNGPAISNLMYHKHSLKE